MRILNGPTGTELQRRGYQTKLPLWSASANLDAPELVFKIEEDYVKAGADIIVTNTFRTIRRTWKKIGKEDQAPIANKAAVDIALKVKEKYSNIEIAGSITSLEDCYRPDLVPSQKELDAEHEFQVAQFADSGIDFFLLETLNTIREAETIAKYASQTKIPIWVSFVTSPEGDLMSSESIKDAVKALEKYNIQAVLVNCRMPSTISKAVDKLVEAFPGTKGAYANGVGQPDDDLGWKFDKHMTPESYLEYAKKWADQGLEVIGGCCGTNPEFIKVITDYFKKQS